MPDHLTMLRLSTIMNVRSLWLVIILASAFCCSSGTVGSSKIMCLDGERDALLRFKQGLVDESKTLASWKTDTDCCRWRGIACNNQTGHVITLDLSPSHPYLISTYIPLRGEVSPSLLELRYLSYLDLSFNDFGGAFIPKFIGSMSQLKQLKLTYTNFGGPVPSQLGNLSNLYTLDLSGNYYVRCENLEWLSHLSSLRYLNLSSVDLSGVMNWPHSLSKLHSLIELHLSDSDLPDVNQRSLSYINSSTSLQILVLSFNSLNSSIFYWIANLSSNFVHIDLSYRSTFVSGNNIVQDSILDVFTDMVSLVYLDLSDNQLEGGIPKSFQNLCSLDSLILSYNHLSGNIEDTLETLSCSKKTLENLDLSSNQYWGTLPDLTRFSKIRELRLSNNQLNGSLPDSVGQLSRLEGLYLGSNSLSGVITEAHFSNLSRLHSLDISGNHYSFNLSSHWSPPFNLNYLVLSNYNGSQDFPKWIQTQTNLTQLYMSDVGVVTEAHFSNLSRLLSLGISGYLSINLSSEWSPPFQLEVLDMSDHKGSQAFPKWIQTQTNLTALYMSNASISDSIPDRFWDPFHRLERLYLEGNQIHGTLPSFPPTLQVICLSNNMFSGPLSSLCESQPPRDLMSLDLSDNLLSGEIPDCWMVFQSMIYLNLGKNKLSGKVPSWFGGLQSLEWLMLQNNSFHGELPSLENCTHLTFLDVGDNSFHGELPSLENCTHLTFLDLGDNSLSGNIPAWIGPSLTNLLCLRLRNNQLSGIIPLSLCNLATVHVLDLSGNNISGVLPYCFNNITALASDTRNAALSVVLEWKGLEFEFPYVMGMRYIDVSRNYLVGEIPDSVTSMTKLISFNLSRNNLTGNLPENFGNLKMLESLDFSRNNLSGGIPSSFSRLNFLQFLDLSHNNLSGRIPLGTQLQSFNASSYADNSGLCGLPLTDICPGDDDGSHGTRGSESENNKQVEVDDDDGLVSLGFFISMVLGFVSGFWIVCGSLMLKSSWRYAFFRFLDSLCIPGTRIFKA